MHFGKIQLASLVWINLNLIKPETHSHFSTTDRNYSNFPFFTFSQLQSKPLKPVFNLFELFRLLQVHSKTARKPEGKPTLHVINSYVYFQKMLLVVVLFQIMKGKEIDWSSFPHRPMVECECAVNVQLRGMPSRIQSAFRWSKINWDRLP